MRELSDCDMICISASKRIGKVFTIRWVVSSFRAASAVNTSVRRGGHCAMDPPQTLKIKKCINSIRQWRNYGGARASIQNKLTLFSGH